MSSPITTHALDTRLGAPARGVAITLEKLTNRGVAEKIASGVTDNDGRIGNLLAAGAITAGHYRMTFGTGEYFAKQAVDTFYPQVQVDFVIANPEEHYHVPLLISPFGYSTYRGS